MTDFMYADLNDFRHKDKLVYNSVQKVVANFYDSDKSFFVADWKELGYKNRKSTQNSFLQAIRTLKYPILVRTSETQVFLVKVSPDQYNIIKR